MKIKWLIEATLVAQLVVTVLRVAHLIASDIWILRHGRQFRQALDATLRTKAGRQRMNDPRERWRLYKAHGAGRLPWLFAGIKSSRLMNKIEESSGVKRLFFRVVRGVWRFYTFAPASTAVVLSYLWIGRLPHTRLDDLIILATASILVLGVLAVAADGVLASARMGASARYHSFGWPPPRKEDLALHELSLVIGSAIIALIATTSLIVLIAVRFNGYGSFGSRDGIMSQVWHSAFITLTAIVGQGFADPRNGFGFLGATLSIFVQVSYVMILFGATQKTWQK